MLSPAFRHIGHRVPVIVIVAAATALAVTSVASAQPLPPQGAAGSGYLGYSHGKLPSWWRGPASSGAAVSATVATKTANGASASHAVVAHGRFATGYMGFRDGNVPAWWQSPAGGGNTPIVPVYDVPALKSAPTVAASTAPSVLPEAPLVDEPASVLPWILVAAALGLLSAGLAAALVHRRHVAAARITPGL
jgi:hypothetical protein